MWWWRGIKTCERVVDQLLDDDARSGRRGRIQNWCRARSRYVTHRDGSKPRSIDEVLQKVEEQTGKEGRAAFEKFLAKAMRPSDCVTLPTGMDPSRAPSMRSSRSVIQ